MSCSSFGPKGFVDAKGQRRTDGEDTVPQIQPRRATSGATSVRKENQDYMGTKTGQQKFRGEKMHQEKDQMAA